MIPRCPFRSRRGRGRVQKAIGALAALVTITKTILKGTFDPLGVFT